MTKEAPKSKEVTILTRKDITLAQDLILTTKQLNFLLGKTPQKYIYERPAKGGGVWKYVTVFYIIKRLNQMFGWDWDFEIVEEKITDQQVIVKGRLICRIGNKAITKTQYGRKDIALRKLDKKPLDLGNDCKAAASDALKKCASMIGLASDIYGGDDFKEVEIIESTETVAQAKEEERIQEHIKKARSIKKLEEALGYVQGLPGDHPLAGLYEEKHNKLLAKKK